MDLNWMCEAYRRVRKDAAPGIDGQTVGRVRGEPDGQPAGLNHKGQERQGGVI